MSQKEISEAVIKRLPRYYRYLNDLLDEGTERISSAELSKIMKVTASQIRQDLNHFGGFGQQGYGYNVLHLYQEIGKILGLDKAQTMVIIGGGRLGKALANYVRFEKRGFKLLAVFDINPSLIGQEIRNTRIYPMEQLSDFLDQNKVDILTLAIPRKDAPDIAKMAAAHGVHAIWNFTPVDLNLYLNDSVAVENVHLSESLMKLSCNLQRLKAEGEEV